MWWEVVKDWITWFFNLTLPVVGLSVGMVCLVAWRIFARSSFGKKQIKEAREKADKMESKAKEIEEKFEKDKEAIKQEADAKIKAIETYYETKLAQGQAKKDELESFIISVCGHIHNEKVSALVEDYKNKVSSYQTIMTDKINEAKAEVMKSYEKRMKELEDTVYGKEEQNNSSTEEALQ